MKTSFIKIEPSYYQAEMKNKSDSQHDSMSAKEILKPEQEVRLQEFLSGVDKYDPMAYRRSLVSKKHDANTPMISKDELESIARLQNIFSEPVFISHRKIFGPAIVFGKKLAHRIIKKLLGLVLARQFELNQRIFNLAMTIHILENRIKTLEDTKDSQ